MGNIKVSEKTNGKEFKSHFKNQEEDEDKQKFKESFEKFFEDILKNQKLDNQKVEEIKKQSLEWFEKYVEKKHLEWLKKYLKELEKERDKCVAGLLVWGFASMSSFFMTLDLLLNMKPWLPQLSITIALAVPAIIEIYSYIKISKEINKKNKEIENITGKESK
jgi:hypothetical protein